MMMESSLNLRESKESSLTLRELSKSPWAHGPHSLLLLLHHLGAGDLRAGNAEKCAVSAREMRGNAYRMQTEGGDLNYTRMYRRCTGDALECAPNATRKNTYMPAVIPGRACRGASPLQPPMQPKMRRRRSECVRMRKNVMEYRMQECRRMHMRH